MRYDDASDDEPIPEGVPRPLVIAFAVLMLIARALMVGVVVYMRANPPAAITG